MIIFSDISFIIYYIDTKKSILVPYLFQPNFNFYCFTYIDLTYFSDIISIMISIKINDIKNFMQKVLIDETFDSFLIKEGEINTGCTFSFNGRINRDFYDEDELSSVTEDFILWKNVKHICYEMIRGKKVPTRMKFIFASPVSTYDKIISDCDLNITSENIGGLYIHILYENNSITIITGTSLNIFTMDKSLDKYWDNIVTQFLNKHFDIEII